MIVIGNKSRDMCGSFSVLALGLLGIVGVQAQTSPTYSGITYATYSTSEGAKVCKLDVYIPTVGSPPYPVLVYVHGGGWSGGTRTETGYVPIEVLSYGIATVAIDYRLTSEAHQYGTVDGTPTGAWVPVTWPAQIHDCKAAIRWVRGKAATYGFDASRICAFGFSAGGHLVAALGTMGGVTNYTRGGQTIDMEGSVGGYDNLSSQVQAVCDYSGPTDILNMAPDVTTPPGCIYNFDASDSPSSMLVGSTAYSLGIGNVRANLNNPTVPYPFLAATTLSANPIAFVRPGMPPMYIVHGSADNVVPSYQSVRLYNALLASNNVATLTIVPNAGHGGFGSTVVAATVSWIVGVLKNCPSFATQPLTQSVSPGGTATFTVVATGGSPLSYQWQKNQTNLSDGGHYSGCTTNTLTITGVDSNDVASYRCVVTNACGSTTSSSATLTVSISCPPTSLVNADFEGGNTSGVANGWAGYQRSPNPTTTWTIQTNSPPGAGSLQYQQIANTSSAGGGGVRQNITGCVIGAAYTISGWMRGNSQSYSTCAVKMSPAASTSWATAIDLNPPQTVTGSTWVSFSGNVVATGTNMTLWLDGQTGSNGLNKAECFDSVTVTCAGLPTPLRFDSVNVPAPNQVGLTLSGPPGGSVTIRCSSNLVNWVTLTNLPNPTGTVQFTDTSATNALRRFYRATSP